MKTNTITNCLLTLIVLMLGTPATQAREQNIKGPATGDFTDSILVNGLPRDYCIHVPASYTGKSAVPLVLEFHGGGGTADKQDRISEMNAVADRNGFIVVCPQGMQKHWNDGRKLPDAISVDDIAFVKSLIGKLEARYQIDTKRIYATGISNGGFFSERLAFEMPDTIAAAAMVVASLTEDLKQKHTTASKAIPVMFMLGTNDPLVPFNGGEIHVPFGKSRGTVVSATDAISFWVKHNSCKNTPKVTEVPNTDPSDGCRAMKYVYPDPAKHNDVVFYKIDGGGHTWPGGWQYMPPMIVGKVCRDFNGSDAIWEFFKAHPMP
jgi:polyhydroxybutyrate depolymerase